MCFTEGIEGSGCGQNRMQFVRTQDLMSTKLVLIC